MALIGGTWRRGSRKQPHTLNVGGRNSRIGVGCPSIAGHSPDHVTYATGGVIFSGDVLFQGSVGRVDLPGGDWPTLLASIETLMAAYPPETRVHPGHMGLTTLGDERATNPFLRELAHEH